MLVQGPKDGIIVIASNAIIPLDMQKYAQHMGHEARKPVYGRLRTKQAQTSLCAV